MSDTPRSRAEVRAPQTFSKLHPEIFDNAPVHMDWVPKPVLVLVVRPNQATTQEERDLKRQNLVRCLSEAGYTGSQANRFELQAYPPELSWPRNLEWKKLPAVSHPVSRLFFNAMESLDDEGRGPADGSRFMMEDIGNDPRRDRLHRHVHTGVETMVIDSCELSPELIRAATAPLDGADSLPKLMHFDGSSIREVSQEEIDAARARFLPQERFVYNHAVNMLILSSRALYMMARDEGWPRSMVAATMPSLQFFKWRWAHPLVLQMLHAIKRSGPAVGIEGMPKLMQVGLDNLPWVYANGLDFIEKTGDGNEWRFVWRGSGKYPEWAFGLGEIVEVTGDGGMIKGFIARDHHGVFDWLRELQSQQLIDLDGPRVAVTTRGLRFLELVGDASYDQDLLLRWRTPEGEMGRMEDVPAMDRWLNRVFRAMKRKVSHLPASPFAEDGVPWKPVAENILMVRGGVIPLDEDDFKNPAVVEALLSIDRENAGKAMADMRRGLIRSAETVDGDAQPHGAWFGVPLGSFNSADVYQNRVDLFMDLREIDAKAKAEAARLPECLRKKPFVDAITTADAGRTSEACARFIDPPSIMESKEGDVVGHLVKGRVLKIEKLGAESEEIKVTVGIHAGLRDTTGQQTTDGLRVYGDAKESATLSHGLLLGLVNFTAGKIAQGRQMSEYRWNRMQSDWARDRRQFPVFFEHPDLSEEGLWAILPDGRFFRLKEEGPTPPPGAEAPETQQGETQTDEAVGDGGSAVGQQEADGSHPSGSGECQLPGMEGVDTNTEEYREFAKKVGEEWEAAVKDFAGHQDRRYQGAPRETEEREPKAMDTHFDEDVSSGFPADWDGNDDVLEEVQAEAGNEDSEAIRRHGLIGPPKGQSLRKPTPNPRARRAAVFERIYREEWLRFADPEGVVEAARKVPMSIATLLGVPSGHAGYLNGVGYSMNGIAGPRSNPVCELVVLERGEEGRQKTENQWTQAVRKLVNDGNSVVYVAREAAHVPAVFQANGPVVSARYNAFELAARTLLRCEKAFLEEGLEPIVPTGAGASGSSVSSFLKRDGSVLADGKWSKVEVSAALLVPVVARMREAAVNGSVDVGMLASMSGWERRARVKGAAASGGPESLSEIPGLGRVSERLQRLYKRMEGDGGKVGIILHGDPGTGKTMIARTLARDTGRHFVLGSFAEWQGAGDGHLGSTLKAMRASFDEAKSCQPSLLFIDEMDSIGSRQAKNLHEDYWKVVINSFLELVQGFHGRGDVVLVGATNSIEKLDPAILRSGRFGDHVLIPQPNRGEVAEIVKWYLDKAASRCSIGEDIDLTRLTNLAEGAAPAAIQSLVEEAVSLASEDGGVLTAAHVDAAMGNVGGGTKKAGENLSAFFTLHEASRAVAVHLLSGVAGNVACLRDRPGLSSWSGLVFDAEAGEEDATSSALVRHMTIELAGMAGSVLAGGANDAGGLARRSIEKARSLATGLVSLGTGPENVVRFVAMSDPRAVDAAVAAWLDWAYAKAEGMLKPYRTAIQSLAATVKKEGYLDAEALMREMERLDVPAADISPRLKAVA